MLQQVQIIATNIIAENIETFGQFDDVNVSVTFPRLTLNAEIFLYYLYCNIIG